MKKHLPLILVRLAIALCVALALPIAHMRWGQEYPGDGQQAFGFIAVFCVIGMGAAASYLLATSTWHFFRRIRPRFSILLADIILGVFFIALLVYGGIKAAYSDSAPNGRAAGGVTPEATRRR